MKDIRAEMAGRFSSGRIKSFDCGPGWDWILYDLDEKLSYLDYNYKITQVKEKFGTLRFYYSPQIARPVVQDLMEDAVRAAERSSATTCENCGNSSTNSSLTRGIQYDPTAVLKSLNGMYDGWLKVLCDSCAAETNYKTIKKECDCECD